MSAKEFFQLLYSIEFQTLNGVTTQNHSEVVSWDCRISESV